MKANYAHVSLALYFCETGDSRSKAVGLFLKLISYVVISLYITRFEAMVPLSRHLVFGPLNFNFVISLQN